MRCLAARCAGVILARVAAAATVTATASASSDWLGDAAPVQRRNVEAQDWCSETPCVPQKTQPPCQPPPPPSPSPPVPRCHSLECPDDFINSGLTGTFPDGSDPCNSSHICVKDVFPGCGCYRGDCDSAWGIWCEDAIAAFDTGGVVNGTSVSGHSAPKNIGGDPYTGNPIYYFAAAKPSSYILFLPPANALPISASSGRYEYFLFQYLRCGNASFAPFMYKNDHFTKTGSGQT